jgi:hypothetical protein
MLPQHSLGWLEVHAQDNHAILNIEKTKKENWATAARNSFALESAHLIVT